MASVYALRSAGGSTSKSRLILSLSGVQRKGFGRTCSKVNRERGSAGKALASASSETTSKRMVLRRAILRKDPSGSLANDDSRDTTERWREALGKQEYELIYQESSPVHSWDKKCNDISQ